MTDSPREPAAPPIRVSPGEWVEIELVVLPAPARARNVPPDTALTDFVARVRGFLTAAADLGGPATVRTLLDRNVEGRLVAVNPRNPASFGDPVPELLRLGIEARHALDGAGGRGEAPSPR